jgi:hypothetical protein
MKDLYYTILVHFFYFIGDALSKLPGDTLKYFTYGLYTNCMHLSEKFDEKLDHKYWSSNDDFQP